MNAGKAHRHTTHAYRDYMINVHPLTGAVWISKGGQHIAYATSVEAAHGIVNALVGA